jgi:hypothetical protein
MGATIGLFYSIYPLGAMTEIFISGKSFLNKLLTRHAKIKTYFLWIFFLCLEGKNKLQRNPGNYFNPTLTFFIWEGH